MTKFVPGNPILVKKFLKLAGNSIETFRYFNKREVSIVSTHLYNIILLKDDLIVGYGHLEEENQKIWLGVCVIESEKGNGFGKKIIRKLIDFCIENKIEEIYLTVDSINLTAIRLYENFNFKIEKIYTKYILMKLKNKI